MLENQKIYLSPYLNFFKNNQSEKFQDDHLANTITTPKQSDIPELIEVIKQTYLETYPAKQSYIQDVFNPKLLSVELKNPNCIVFIAKEKNKIIGYSKMYMNYPKQWVLLDCLYILRDYQSKNYGKKLLQNNCLYAVINNKSKMKLILLNNNKYFLKTKYFYKQSGFVTDHNQISGLGELLVCQNIKNYTPYLSNQPQQNNIPRAKL